MNNTIPFHSAPHAPQITVDVNILTMLKQAASCLSEMASENGERRPMNTICDTTAKSETLSVKGCKVKITYAPADTDCLDAIQKLLQTTILRTAGHTAA